MNEAMTEAMRSSDQIMDFSNAFSSPFSIYDVGKLKI
jgi:hypothetical protein